MTGNRLWKKLLLCFGLVVIPLMAILSFFFAHSNRLQAQNDQALNENLALQTVSAVRQQVQLAENMCKSLLQNDMLITFLDREYHTMPDLAYYRTTIQDFVKVTNGVSDIRLKLFLENETIPMGFGIFYPVRYLEAAPAIQAFYADPAENELWLDGNYAYTGNQRYRPNATDTYCYFLKIKAGTQTLGVVMASIPKRVFAVQQPGEEQPITPLYIEGCCVYNHTGRQFSTQEIRALAATGAYGDCLSTKYEFPKGPFSVLVVTRRSQNNFIVPAFVIMCIACVLLTGIYILFIRHLLRDIDHCLDGIEVALQNNFQEGAGEGYIQDVRATRRDEIALLAQRILLLIHRIRGLLKQQVKEKTAAKQAQLLALQHQINPHFLYNTMEVFSSRMELAGLYEDSAAIAAFCRMLRYNINSRDMTTLADELEQVQNYLAIQKVRGIPFSLTTEIPEALLPERTIRFLLEPFIENSFKYRGSAEVLKIRIAAEDCGDLFRIEIRNNGELPGPARVAELNERFRSAPASVETSGDKIGLNNINSRLKLFYGEAFCIHVNCEGGWTRFIFEIEKRPACDTGDV